MVDDNALLKGCAKEDSDSQRKLYEAYAPRLLAVCMRYAKSSDEAEDVLQEAFVKIFDKISTFRNESSLYYWMKRIVVNTALNSQRSKLYLFPMVDVTTLNKETDENFSLKNFSYDDLLGMIQKLPTGCQVIFNLYAIEGYQHKEIAEQLEISEGTSKSQYARAKSLLQEQIKLEEKRIYEQAR